MERPVSHVIPGPGDRRALSIVNKLKATEVALHIDEASAKAQTALST